MSRRSAATVREAPVQAVATAAAGNVVVHGETFTVETRASVEVVDLTDRVMRHLARTGVREGMAALWSMHTTCALFVNEYQAALAADITRCLEELVAGDRYYRHNDPAHSDCDRGNAAAHLRAMLLGHAVALQMSGGEVVLGQWQRILLAELDGPRARTIRWQVFGVR